MIERSAFVGLQQALISGNTKEIESARRVLGTVLEEKHTGHLHDPTLEEVQTFSGLQNTPTYEDERLIFFSYQNTIYKNGREIILTPVENALFTTLAQKSGRVVTYQELDEPSAPGEELKWARHRIRKHIRQIQEKLEPGMDRKKSIIQNVRGVGFRLKRSPNNEYSDQRPPKEIKSNPISTTIIDFRKSAQQQPAARARRETDTNELVLKDGDLTYYPERRELVIGGETRSVTHREHQLLCLLLNNPGTAFRKEDIFTTLLATAKGLTFASEEIRALKTHISRLRKKIDPKNTPVAASRIRTLHRFGYAWRNHDNKRP